LSGGISRVAESGATNAAPAAAKAESSAVSSGAGKAAESGVTRIEKVRTTAGGDGAQSKHVIEKAGDKTISKQHIVTKKGEVIHQHQDHIGASGSVRRFP